MENDTAAAASGERASREHIHEGVSFVVPAFNEQSNITDTVREIGTAASGLSNYEIIIVNDCSSDNTGEIIDGLARSNSRVRAVHNQENLGLGGAYKIGVANATMTYVIMVPGDNNHPADGIVPILECIGKADIIIPYVDNPQVRHWHRRLISWTFRKLLNLIFRLKVSYYNGLVVHRLALLKTITIETNGFAYQAEALVKLLRRGASYIDVGVPIAQRGDRSSRAFQIKNVKTVAMTVFRLMRTS